MSTDRGGLRIETVDPFDDEAFDTWHAVHLASQRHGREPAAVTAWTREEMRAQLQRPGRRSWAGIFLGRVDGEPVATGHLLTPLLDNLDQAQVSVDVLAAHRRHGHGTRMLGHLTEQALARGRRLWIAEASWPMTAPADGAGEPGPGLLRDQGFTLGLVEVLRVLDPPPDPGHLRALAARAAPHHAAYEVRSFVGRVPDDLLAGWATVTASLSTEAPMGSLSLEAEVADPALVREEEELLARQDRTRHAAVALGPGGRVVGYTEIVTTGHEPGLAYQWGTVVDPAHRGHRLGLALKAAAHLLLHEHVGDLRMVRTWNAETNDHMVAVNDLLGYRPIERYGGFERRA